VLQAAALAQTLNQTLHVLHVLPHNRHPENVAADAERDPFTTEQRNRQALDDFTPRRPSGFTEQEQAVLRRGLIALASLRM
jgi:hypothetical protein